MGSSCRFRIASIFGLLLVPVLAGAATAATITWTGAVNSSWHIAGNWNLGRVPTAGDDVVIPNVPATSSVVHSSGTTTVNSFTADEPLVLSGGTIDIAAPSASNLSFSMNGGTLTGVGDLSINGSFAFTNGTMSGGGTTTVAVGVTWSWGPTTSNQLTRTLVNHGTANVNGSGSEIRIDPPGILRNFGTVNVNENVNFRGAHGQINNEDGGRMFKSGGVGPAMSQWSPALVNNGLISLTSGILLLGEDGAASNNDSILVAVGTTLRTRNLSSTAGSTMSIGGTHTVTGNTTIDIGATYLNSASLSISDGSLSLGPDVTVPNLSVLGLLTGAGDVQVTSSFGFNGGTVSGSGSLTISAGVNWTWNSATAGGSLFRELINDGYGTRFGGAGMQIAPPGVFRNRSGAIFEIQGDGPFINSSGLIENQAGGVIVKTSGTGTTSINPTFTNFGTVRVLTGTVQVENAFTNFSVGTLTGGTYDLQGVFRYSGGDITTNAATILLDGTTSRLAKTGGADALLNLGTNGAGAGLTIKNSKVHTLGPLFTNSGTVVVGASSVLSVNAGYRQLAGETRLEGGTLASTAFVDIQNGLLAGSGTVDGDLTNDGTVAPGASPGGLVIDGTFDQTAGGSLHVELAGLTPGTQFDHITTTGAATLNGELSVALIDGYVPAAADTFDVVSAPSVSGTFATDNLPVPAGTGCLDLEYPPTAVRLRTLAGAEVLAAPVSQDVCAGSPVTFMVTAAGTNVEFQWRKDGVDIGGATDSSFTIPSLAPGDAGAYDVVVTNLCTADTSDAATLVVSTVPPAFTADPMPEAVCEGDPVTLTAAVTGSSEPTLQWRKNGVDIPGATSSSFTILAVAPGDAGVYDVVATNACGADTSDAALLAVNLAPQVTTHPESQDICQGFPFNVTVNATGTPAPTFQWRKHGVDIGGATSASFSIPSVAPGDAGSYDVVVTNLCGSDTSAPAVLEVHEPPVVTTHPAGEAVCDGAPLNLSVTATGTPAPTFQWRKDGVSIGGATSSVFTIPAVAPTDSGSYDVIVTNVCGADTSAAALVTVNPTLVIIEDPEGDTVCYGAPFTFSVTATGASLTYQWRKNGVDIPGANLSTLDLGPVEPGESGSYDVIVGSACGTDTSATATLVTTLCLDVIYWTGLAGDGSWHTPGNWHLNRLPESWENVRIPDLSNTAAVSHTMGATLIRSLDCDEALNLSTSSLQAPDGIYLSKGVTMSSGALRADLISLSGTSTWTGGGLQGVIRVESNDTLIIAPTAACFLRDTLENYGTCLQAGTGELAVGVSGHIMNADTGIYDLTSSGGITGQQDFLNDGLLRKSSGLASTLDCWLTNEGTVRVETGRALVVEHLVNLGSGLSGGTLTGGTYEVLGNLSLHGDILANAASITLSGSGAHMGARLRRLASNSGTLLIQDNVQTLDSLLVNSGTLTIETGIVTLPVGLRQVSGQTTLRGGLLTCPLVDLQGGTLRGRGTVIDGHLVNDGVVMIEPATGSAFPFRSRDYTQTAGGSLLIDIAGTTPRTEFDQLVVLEDAQLDGSVTVAMTGGFTPAPTDSFPVVLAVGSLTGEFAVENLPGGDCPSIVYGPTTATFRLNPNFQIVAHPQGQTVCGGDPASLSVAASGQGLSFQWRRNGTPMPGATSAIYAIASMTVGDAGTYDVIVSTPSCVDTSDAATLLYQRCQEDSWNSEWDAASGDFPDADCPWTLVDTATPENPVLAGNALTIATSERTELLHYQQTNFLDIPDTLLISARVRVVSETHLAGNPRRGVGIGFMTTATAGNFLWVGRDTVFIWSGLAQQGATAFVDTDDQFHEYLIEVQGTSVLVYQDDILILTGSLVDNPGMAGTPPIYWGDVTQSSFSVSEWEFFRHNANSTPCGSPVTILVQPQGATVCADSAASLSVTATGVGLAYQWRRNGTDVPGATAATLTIPALAPGDAGVYDVIVGNGFDADTSDTAVLTYRKCVEPAWTAEWIAEEMALPEDICPWTLFDDAMPETPVLGSGHMVLETSVRTENMYYQQTANLSDPDTLYIGTRLRLVSETHLEGNPRRGVGIGFQVGPNAGNFLFVGRDTVFIWSALAQQGATAFVDTDDQFHDYLIEVRNDAELLVYQDDLLILSGSVITDPGFAGTPPIQWGDITLSSFAVSHWQSVRHNASTLPCESVSGVGDGSGVAFPEPGALVAMAAPHPNPARGATTLTIRAAESLSGAALRVYDVAGRLVADLPLDVIPPGESNWPWDGHDGRGRPVTSGMYFIRLEFAGRVVGSTRVLMLK